MFGSSRFSRAFSPAQSTFRDWPIAMRLNFGTISPLEIFPYYGQKAPVDQGNLRSWDGYPGENILDSPDENYI
jgi:hypothetical protein